MSSHPVTSRPISEAKAAPRTVGGEKAAGIALLIFGALLWMAGARYTLHGWVYGLNWFADWMGLPFQVPPIVGVWVLLAIPIGIVYSLVELYRPWTIRRGDWSVIALIWLIWLVIVVTDGGSTFLGVKQPAADAWPVTKQIAASDALSGAWSTVLTFVPEWFIIGGIALLRR